MTEQYELSLHVIVKVDVGNPEKVFDAERLREMSTRPEPLTREQVIEHLARMDLTGVLVPNHVDGWADCVSDDVVVFIEDIDCWSVEPWDEDGGRR